MTPEWIAVYITLLGMLCSAIWCVAEMRASRQVVDANLANLSQSTAESAKNMSDKFVAGVDQLSKSIDNLATVVKGLDETQRRHGEEIAVLQAKVEALHE